MARSFQEVYELKLKLKDSGQQTFRRKELINQILIETKDGVCLASREAFMMVHPAREPDCTLAEGDIIELEEGFFVLNDDLNPTELATEEQISQAKWRR